MLPTSLPSEMLTHRVHRALAGHLRHGDIALDATCGNGHDTALLAQIVGSSGQVHAFDLQQEAIAQTHARLTMLGLLAPVRFHCADHARLSALLPAGLQGRLRVAVFNLGYRPGSDHHIVTAPTTTLAALNACTDLLSRDGAISVVAYSGHPGGAVETDAVTHWSAALAPQDWHVIWTCPQGVRRPAPRWLWLTRQQTQT